MHWIYVKVSVFKFITGDVYGDDIMKLNKKGRKRGPMRKNSSSDFNMSIDMGDTAVNTGGKTSANTAANTTATGVYKSKYAQPVVGSYKS